MALRRTTDISGLSDSDQSRVKDRANAYAKRGMRSDLALEKAFHENAAEAEAGRRRHRTNVRPLYG